VPLSGGVSAVTDRVTLHGNVVLDGGGRGAVRVQGEQRSVASGAGGQSRIQTMEGAVLAV